MFRSASAATSPSDSLPAREIRPTPEQVARIDTYAGLVGQVHDREIVAMVDGYSSPELINDGALPAPSKRIIAELPEYKALKASAGVIVAQAIGLPTMG